VSIIQTGRSNEYEQSVVTNIVCLIFYHVLFSSVIKRQ